MKPVILVLGGVSPALKERLSESFEAVFYNDLEQPAAYLEQEGGRFSGLFTNAGVAAPDEIVDQLPNLQVISSIGVGFEKFNQDKLQPRKIRLSCTPDVLTDCVADLAMALVLDCGRRLSAGDRYVRAGHWGQQPFALGRQVSHKTLGILGMGRIGLAIAKRAEAFNMTVVYHNRQQRTDCAYEYKDSVASLAQAADYLVVAVTGGPATENLVDAKALEALGPDGYLINISRGTVVDEPALVTALQRGTIAGAGLDVYVHEPQVPDALKSLENVVLLPHIGSATQETRQAMANLAFDNLQHFYAQGEVLTPVPWAVYDD